MRMLGEIEVKAVQALEIIIIMLPCWKVKHSFRKLSSTGSSTGKRWIKTGHRRHFYAVHAILRSKIAWGAGPRGALWHRAGRLNCVYTILPLALGA
jgi:hypothetical protein